TEDKSSLRLASIRIRIPTVRSRPNSFRHRRTRRTAMLVSLWRRWWHGIPVPSRKNGLSGGRRLAYRPQIESLEGRALPALGRSTLCGLVPVVTAASMLQQKGSSMPAGITPLHVTVSQNASESVLDLGPVFAAMQGLQHEGGLHLTVLGN